MHPDVDKIHFFSDKIIRSYRLIPTPSHGNVLYRIKTDKREYVLRFLQRNEGDLLGEYYAGLLAYHRGIGPEVLAYERDNSALILAYLSGEQRERLSQKDMQELSHTLRRWHRLPENSSLFPRLELEKLIRDNDNSIGDALTVLSSFGEEKGLCHCDLTPRNLIWHENGVALIDFEFVSVGDIYFDLAAVSVEFDLNEQEEQMFLSSYHEGNRCNKEKMSVYKILYRELRQQWFDRHGGMPISQKV